MAIEIRELLIRATVTYSTGHKNDKSISRDEFRREKRRIIDECVDRMREMLEDYRSGR